MTMKPSFTSWWVASRVACGSGSSVSSSPTTSTLMKSDMPAARAIRARRTAASAVVAPAGRLGRVGIVIDGAHYGDRRRAGIDRLGSILPIDAAHGHEGAVGDGGDLGDQPAPDRRPPRLGWGGMDRSDCEVIDAVVHGDP